MPAFALTIFSGAFLLFLVQPLAAKFILPWFGGGPGVWTTCLLFFQWLLLAGYGYAYVTSRWMRPRAQILLHFALLAGALLCLPIIPADKWKPYGEVAPALRIVTLLGAMVGLPYFLLSSTGPLMQHWFSRIYPGRSPYRLFALSNAGSLLALISYPFWVEPRLTRQEQATVWGWGLAVYGLGCCWCGYRMWRAAIANGGARSTEATSAGSSSASPSSWSRLMWLLWPACASALLLATTNKICQDVAVVPFLWVLPLGLYLLSFIICFDRPAWYSPRSYTLLLMLAIFALCWGLIKGKDTSMRLQIAAYSVGLFICCLVCHGEVYRLRPEPRHLTGFYLLIATGGALGGFGVAILAPLIFTSFYELHYGIWCCVFLFAIARTRDAGSAVPTEWRWVACALALATFAGLDWALQRVSARSAPAAKSLIFDLRMGYWFLVLALAISWIARKKFKTFPYWRALACVWLWLVVAGLAVTLWLQGRRSNPDIVYRSRNFYGSLTIFEHDRENLQNHHRLLQHGRITHGMQFVKEPESNWPTTYYATESGIGMAARALPDGPLHMGVVGLGTGTMAAYGAEGDHLRFYEIDPAVYRVANSWFRYLSNCPASIDVALGDARLSLEREAPQEFDLLALDAFSSDAIPTHLLTREAFALYRRHVRPGGIIAVHISNHYVDLEPVIRSMAREFNFYQAVIDYENWEGDWWLYSSTWVLLTGQEPKRHMPGLHWKSRDELTGPFAFWTDDFASLYPLLK